MDNGGTDKTCAPQAIITANAMFSESAIGLDFETGVIENTHGWDIENPLEVCLQEASLDNEFQLILPVGTFHSNFYGRITITKSMVLALVKNYSEKVLGEREPFIDTDHDNGAANGWIRDLQAQEDGLYAKIEWTDKGRDLLQSEQYRYFSAHIAEVVDIKTGDKVYPVLIAVALTNTPVMNTMPAAHLAEQLANEKAEAIKLAAFQVVADFVKAQRAAPPADKDGGTRFKEGSMDLTEALEALAKDLGDITDEQRATVMKIFGITAPAAPAEPKPDASMSEVRGKLEDAERREGVLMKELKRKTIELATLTEEKLLDGMNAAMSDALQAGKITPKTRPQWEEMYRSDPEKTLALLAELTPVIELGERGTGRSQVPEEKTALEISKEEARVHDVMGHSDEDVEKFGGEWNPNMLNKE